MVWDRWGVRKQEYDRIKKYRRTKKNEGLFNRTPSSDTLFKANTDSQSWDGFSFTSGNFTPSPADIRAQLNEEQTGIGSCISNKQCPTGYACIDGKCVKIYTRDGTTWGTCGDERLDFPCKGQGPTVTNECSSSQPGPGSCQDSDCGSGPKCCRQNADGSVSCYCGNCEDVEWGLCSIYCDTTYKTFGYVAAGCSKPGGVGVCDGNICNECSECEPGLFGEPPQCQRYEAGDPSAPCWCSGVGCDGQCERCDRDSGNCVFDATNCNTCCSVSNPQCDCGPLLPLGGSLSACSPYLGRSCMDVLYEKIGAACSEKCAKDDPCAATGSTKYCTSGSAPIDPATNPEGPAGFTCPQGKVCSYTGFLEGGGQTCYFYSTWTLGEIPNHCKEPGCNGNSDCAECQLCNENGECESDPACENILWDLYIRPNGVAGRTSSCTPPLTAGVGTWFRYVQNAASDTLDRYYAKDGDPTYYQGQFLDPTPAPGAIVCGETCPGYKIYTTLQRINSDGTETQIANLGYSQGCDFFFVFGGGSTSGFYDRTWELQWVIAGSGPPPD